MGRPVRGSTFQECGRAREMNVSYRLMAGTVLGFLVELATQERRRREQQP